MKLIQFFKGSQRGAKEFGSCLSILLNSALLFIVYLIGIGITSIFAKILQKRFLETKFSEGTYWSDLNLKRRPKKKYYMQF